MLERLRIKNYVLIDSLDIQFYQGFSVITGETGAGKSILLGALGLLLGNKGDAKVIKQGEQRCMVEGCFFIEQADSFIPFFEKYDLDFDGKECIIRREMSATGKSRSFVNDTPVTMACLKELGGKLIDIHSQHKNLLLNESEFKLMVLDIVARTEGLAAEYAAIYRKYRDTNVRIVNLMSDLERAQDERDYIQFQLNQLKECNLQDGEQEMLENEVSMLGNVEEIKQIYFDIDTLLNGNETNVVNSLKSCCSQLQRLQRIAPQADDLYNRMESLHVELKDIAQEVTSNLETIDYDPHRLEEAESRLNTIYDLQHKHHVASVAELLDIQDKLQKELQQIELGQDDIQVLRKQNEELYQKILAMSAELSEKRRQAAEQIEQKMVGHLKQLGMPHVQFRFQFDPVAEPGVHGSDRVTILFSSNKNMPLQDLSQIASGGEIARVMLSLKALISQNILMPTLVFDEIDTGVSGSVAEKMAVLMKEIAQGSRQVICITHLPQIAALGMHHYRVYKKEHDSTTVSTISELSPEERVQEVAHMLSGSELTQAAITNAKELLKQS